MELQDLVLVFRYGAFLWLPLASIVLVAVRIREHSRRRVIASARLDRVINPEARTAAS